MSELLEEISQITIYLKDEQERVNEIALFQPLSRNTAFDEGSKPVQQRKWSYTYQLPIFRRAMLKVQSFIFKKVPFLIPAERLTHEAKFKTVLAMLLAQESLREFFFSNDKRRDNFLFAVLEAAHAIGYKDFVIPRNSSASKICQQLTMLSGKEVSLIENLAELNLQMSALTLEERNEILFRILNRVERPPITSILEIMHKDRIEEIAFTTQYAKYKITEIVNGKIIYKFSEDQATSCIRTIDNSRPGAKGVMNQRCVIDTQTNDSIGTYSGELSNDQHLLEQILFILDLKGEEVFLLENASYSEEKTILFTSLFSWHEFGLISKQHQAIRRLNQKVLKIGDRTIRLNLLHFNISFNALNKYPTPAEMGATIKDINDQALIFLMGNFAPLRSEKLIDLKNELEKIADENDFLKHQKHLLKIVDDFREIKPHLVTQLESMPEEPPVLAAIALLKGKKTDGKNLRGMDLLLYLNILVQSLGISHNKNCEKSTDRSAGASAADKAQHAYKKITGQIFLPGCANESNLSFFKVLYSMYLVWEEPEINAALSTGFVGEKYYQNFFQKNPETTRYLIWWLKKHPELYLGVSDKRS